MDGSWPNSKRTAASILTKPDAVQRIKRRSRRRRSRFQLAGNEINLPFVTADASVQTHSEKKLDSLEIRTLTDDLNSANNSAGESVLEGTRNLRREVNELVLGWHDPYAESCGNGAA